MEWKSYEYSTLYLWFVWLLWLPYTHSTNKLPCDLIVLLIQAFWQGVQVQNHTIWSNPHNNAQSKKIHKILHNTKCLLEILIKTEISIEYQDFWNIFRLFSDSLPSKTTRRLCYPNIIIIITVACAVLGTSLLFRHTWRRGLLGLMGWSLCVFSFSSFDCFDKQRIGLK